MGFKSAQRWLEKHFKPEHVGWSVADAIVPVQADDTDENASASTWADKNKQQRLAAYTYSLSRPGGRLFALCIGLSPGVRLMQNIMSAGEADARTRYFKKKLDARPCQTRVEEDAWGVHTFQFFDDVESLLFDLEKWALIPPEQRTYDANAKCFSIVGRMTCEINELVHKPDQGYPKKTWKAFTSDVWAQEILNDPDCMKDDFTLDFLMLFPSLAELTSPIAKVILLAIALVLHCDTMTLECRFGILRRLKAMLPSKTVPDLGTISAHFLIRHEKTIEAGKKLDPGSLESDDSENDDSHDMRDHASTAAALEVIENTGHGMPLCPSSLQNSLT